MTAPNETTELILNIDVLGLAVDINASVNKADGALIASNFSAFAARLGGRADIAISVAAMGDSYQVTWEGSEPEVVTTDRQELIYHIEGFLVPGLQLLRPDLLFLHSAALVHRGKAFLMTGDSGNGKSTLCWALTHHGCQYLSDELAPLAVTATASALVHPYPHSLNLKRSPAGHYAIAPATPHTGWTYHVPAATLAGGVANLPGRVEHIFLVKFGDGSPAVTPLGHADAAFRIYPNTLNALAHSKSGLSATSDLARNARVYDLRSAADLDATCALVLETLQ